MSSGRLVILRNLGMVTWRSPNWRSPVKKTKWTFERVMALIPESVATHDLKEEAAQLLWLDIAEHPNQRVSPKRIRQAVMQAYKNIGRENPGGKRPISLDWNEGGRYPLRERIPLPKKDESEW